MKSIFSKNSFSKAPGGDRYVWDDVETKFKIPKKGVYIISVTASAKNGAQNKTGDDDDLRLSLDGYEFGKGEIHENKTSWHGFGVAASWDGASLKGGEKTVYFFVELNKGDHVLRFIADGKPELKEVEVFQLDKKGDAVEDVIFDFNEVAAGIKTDKNGIPWKAFVFQSQFNAMPFRIKLIDITAKCSSGKQKGSTDGDNIKVYSNGYVVPNTKSPKSDKYKNFFFSGDQMQGEVESLMIPGDTFIYSESGDFSIELWYDEMPVLEQVKIELSGGYNTLSIPQLDEWLSLNKVYRPVKLSLVVKDAEYFAKAHGASVGIEKKDFEDSEVDACRHFCWSAILTREYSKEDAKDITTNHEVFWMRITNKQNLSRSTIMDLWNNKQGWIYAEKYKDKGIYDLFKLALSHHKIVRNLHEVTEEIREAMEFEVKEFLKKKLK